MPSEITCGHYYPRNSHTDLKIQDLSEILLHNKRQKDQPQHRERCNAAAKYLSKIMYERIEQSYPELNLFDLIVPVPNDQWVPLFSRGVSIGSELASLMKKPFEKGVLIKTMSKNRKGLNNYQRTEIANESYDISKDIRSDNSVIKDKKILLVDDIHTGGSTTKKCAQLLIENGARQIQIFCAAKTVR
jgi:predicted amidophosphoribosyltransferase